MTWRLCEWICSSLVSKRPATARACTPMGSIRRLNKPHQPRLAADPDFAPDVFRGRGVVRLVKLDMAVEVHAALPLLVAGKQARGQRQQGRLLGRAEQRADLLADRPVDPGVGDVLLPLAEEDVLRAEALEAAALEAI